MCFRRMVRRSWARCIRTRPRAARPTSPCGSSACCRTGPRRSRTARAVAPPPRGTGLTTRVGATSTGAPSPPMRSTIATTCATSCTPRARTIPRRKSTSSIAPAAGCFRAAHTPVETRSPRDDVRRTIFEGAATCPLIYASSPLPCRRYSLALACSTRIPRGT